MEARVLARGLRHCRTLDTSSVEESRSVLAREICPHRLVPVAPAPLRTRHDRLRLNSSSLHHISYGVPVRIADARVDDDYLVLIPSSGTSRVTLDGQTARVTPGMAMMLTPGSRFDVAGDAAARTLIWRIPATLLQDTPRSRLASRPLPPGSATMRFLRSLRFAIEEAQAAHGMADEDDFRRKIEELLVFAMLRAWPGETRPERNDVVPACVLLVERLVAAHAHEELTMADLVAAAKVSERSLHRAFRQFRGETPMGHLRSVRLRRVRADLMDAGGRGSVTMVQTRWGVTEFGRFAAQYRRAYGELPSETLRSARRDSGCLE